MGVDVGIKLHVVVREVVDDATSKALFIGEVEEFSQLDHFIERFGVRRAVIDAHPEYSQARGMV